MMGLTGNHNGTYYIFRLELQLETCGIQYTLRKNGERKERGWERGKQKENKCDKHLTKEPRRKRERKESRRT